MFCPKCGKGEQTPNNYCRACGEFLPDLSVRARRAFGGITPEENIRATLILNALSALFAVISAFYLYIAHWGNPATHPSVYFAAAFLLTIAAWQLSNLYIALKLRAQFARRRQGNGAAQIDELDFAGQSNAALPAADTSQFVRRESSVTENTTELLKTIPHKRTDS